MWPQHVIAPDCWSATRCCVQNFLSEILPRHLARHCAAVGSALAVHFAYYPQEAFLLNSTSLLSQYERYLA